MQNRNLRESFYFAIRGIVYVILTQRNMRVHCFMAILALLLGFILNIDTVSLVLVIFAIFLVLITEMLNTAIESTVDLYTSSQKQLAAIAKDVAAGAVFMSSLNAVILGYLVFFQELNSLLIAWYRNFFNILTAPIAIMLMFLVIIIYFYIWYLQKKGLISVKNEFLSYKILETIVGILFFTIFIISEHLFLAILIAAVIRFIIIYLLSMENTYHGFLNLLLNLSGIIISAMLFWIVLYF